MVNLFLANENIKKAIKNLGISQKQKDALISKIPALNEEERVKLIDVLKEIYLLDLEEAEAIERIQKNWKVD